MSNPTGNAVAVRHEQRSLIESIKHPQMQAQIQASLPPSVSLDRFTAVTISAINHNPDLLNAERNSFYNAVVKAAQDGLLPDGNDAVLNIYNTKVGEKWVKKVQYQRMVGGIIKLFEKAGIDAFAESVYQNDEFQFWNDNDGQHIVHKPTRLGQPKGERIGAYAVARRPGGRSAIIQVMDMEDLTKVRAASKSPDKGPWAVWTERMEQKSALHRLKKRVAAIDEEAAKHLSGLDDELLDDKPEPVEQPKPTVPTGNEARPRSLQAVVDAEADAPAEVVDTTQEGDPGPREGDII